MTLKTLLWVGLLAACLFLPALIAPAPSLAWPQGWAVLTGYGVVVMIALATLDQDLLRERAAPGKNFDRRDAVFAVVSGLLLYPLTLVVAGADHAAGSTPSLPTPVTVAAYLLFLAGYTLVLRAMVTNRFFSTIVRMQTDRGHHLVDAGPYAWVRHPGYAGTIVAHLAMPIALGSAWALIPALAGSLTLLPRLGHEEKTLAAELDGFQAYQQRVRWRLLPGVW